jgi:hypothetical protein
VDALLNSLQVSDRAYAALWGGKVGAIYGTAPAPRYGRDVAVVWMLTSPLVERHQKSFLRAARVELARLLDRWPILINLIHTACATALRWARRMGARIGPPITWGPVGAQFHWIEFRREDCHV